MTSQDTCRVRISIDGSDMLVRSQYNPVFSRRARQLGGDWERPSSLPIGGWSEGAWRFDARSADLVRALCLAVYGDDGSDLVRRTDVRLKALADIVATRDLVRILGRTLVEARGRDSGAQVGEHCVLESGEISSGGTSRHWETRVAQGSVFRMYEVPVVMLEGEQWDPHQFKVSELHREAEASALEEEYLETQRKLIVERLAEIDQRLAEIKD